MKKIFQIALPVLLIAISSGCATPYMIDRGHDAKDIFTATVGVGGGTQLRIGPVAQGLCVNMNYCGIQDGDTFCGYDKYQRENGMDGAFLLYTFSRSSQSHAVKERNKTYLGFHLLGIAFPSSIECEQPKYPAPYFTQIDIIAGLGGTVKLGFNPGELLDFILGWTTIDIFKDDLEAKKQKEKSNQVSHRTDNPAVVVR